MKKTIFTGCGTALITPFNEKGVDYKSLEEIIEDQIEGEIDALIVCGTTGESSTMTKEERKETIKFVIDKVNGRTKVIAGTGSNNTKEAIEMSKYAQSVGADGILVVTPYYNKTTQEGLIEHYKVIAQSVKVPVIMYNVPSRTGVNILPETCLELSKIENIVAIKEASGNISQVAKIAALCKDNLDIYSGNDDQIIPVMSLGGKGVISVLSNLLPKYTHEMTMSYLLGNKDIAKDMQLKALNLINALFIEVNPSPIKYAMNIMDFKAGKPRLPLVEPTEKSKKVIEKALKDLELL